MSEKAKELAQKAKTKTKRVLHIDNTQRHFDQNNNEAVSETIQTNAGFNPQLTLSAESSTLQQIREQFPDNIRDLPHMIRHPITSGKRKTASKLATSSESLQRNADRRENSSLPGLKTFARWT